MENKVFLEKLKFGIGDGNLQYYLYNWKCPSMEPDKVRIDDIHLNAAMPAFPLTAALGCVSGRPRPSVAGFLRAATQTLGERSPWTSWYLSPGHTGSPNPENEKNSTDAEAKRRLPLWQQQPPPLSSLGGGGKKLVNHQHPECEVMLCLRYSYSPTLLTCAHAFKNGLTYKRMPWHLWILFSPSSSLRGEGRHIISPNWHDWTV